MPRAGHFTHYTVSRVGLRADLEGCGEEKSSFPHRGSNRPDRSDYVVPASSVTSLYLHVNKVTDILIEEYIT